MSKILKGIGKVFKTVGKVVKKVLPYALAAAAVVFTGGAALGLTPAFGSVAGGLVSSLGLSGTLGAVATGALTYAGYGAALGAVVPGLSVGKGALLGGLTGGVLGATGLAGGAAAGETVAGATNTAANSGSVAGALTGDLTSATIGQTAGGVATTAGGATTAFTNAVAAGGAGATLVPKAAADSFLAASTNASTGLGNAGLIAGAGQGLLTGLEAKEVGKQAIKRDDAQRDYYAANYTLPNNNGLIVNRDRPSNVPAPQPTQNNDPGFYRGGRYVFDQSSGQIVFRRFEEEGAA